MSCEVTSAELRKQCTFTSCVNCEVFKCIVPSRIEEELTGRTIGEESNPSISFHGLMAGRIRTDVAFIEVFAMNKQIGVEIGATSHKNKSDRKSTRLNSSHAQ